jgi:universal stress protein E
MDKRHIGLNLTIGLKQEQRKMKDINNILAIVNHEDDGEIVLQKAMLLAENNGATIHVAKIVYEGFVDLSVHEVEQSQELKSFIMQAEESLVEDLIDPLRSGRVAIESCVVWHKYEYQGILDVAAECSADLIVKATDHPAKEIIRTPQDWNLLRHADIPVMLVKPFAWKENPVVVAAVDMQDTKHEEMSTRILHTANDLASIVKGQLKLINTFPSVEHWVGPITVVVDFDAVRKSVRNEIEHSLRGLAERCGVKPHSVHADEGTAHQAIESLVQSTEAEILVLGTSQRTGGKGIVLGNTSETILHHVNCDVVVLR